MREQCSTIADQVERPSDHRTRPRRERNPNVYPRRSTRRSTIATDRHRMSYNQLEQTTFSLVKTNRRGGRSTSQLRTHHHAHGQESNGTQHRAAAARRSTTRRRTALSDPQRSSTALLARFTARSYPRSRTHRRTIARTAWTLYYIRDRDGRQANVSDHQNAIDHAASTDEQAATPTI